jgi:hypothetical protein
MARRASIMHSGDYAHIDAALQSSTAAYLADPGDALTAAHVGWLHIWRLAENSRAERRVPTITDDAILARRCFDEAVPHNVEGFYLNFGDMLVIAGDWQTARKVYANAMVARDYATWPFSAELQARIAHAPDNVALFNGPSAGRSKPGPQGMANSNAACMACHQR